MNSIGAKFAALGTDHAPGQEVRQGNAAAGATLRGDPLPGTPVDFSQGIAPERVRTIMGPSETESLSDYRLGVAFGAAHLIDRAERLQAIVSLRAPGYSQAVLSTWFEEPAGWLAERTTQHQAIRDDLVKVLRTVPGFTVRPAEAGSYLSPGRRGSPSCSTTSCARSACRPASS